MTLKIPIFREAVDSAVLFVQKFPLHRQKAHFFENKFLISVYRLLPPPVYSPHLHIAPPLSMAASAE